MDSRPELGRDAAGASGLPGRRRIERADADSLSRMLARAFFDDPVSAYLFPSERSRTRRLERYFRFQLRTVFLPHGEGWTTADLAAAALWVPPRESVRTPTLGEALAQLPAVLILGRNLSRAVELVRELDQHHPRRPHWYLATLGTDPDRQGQGLGSALLGEVLPRCDGEGLPAYLESSKEENLAFYERHGFAVQGRMTLPGTAVRLWFMWREPRPPGGPHEEPPPALPDRPGREVRG